LLFKSLSDDHQYIGAANPAIERTINDLDCLGSEGFRASQINHDVALGLRAADQHIAVRRRDRRVRL
jgi:hypothetical protein